VDNVDIFHMYAEMGYDECTEMQLKFQDLQNPSVFITTPKVDGTGLNRTAANHAVISQKFWVLDEQWQAFACISNNPSFRLKHPGVPDSSDGSDGTSYPVTENYTLPVAQATGRVAYSHP